MATDNNLHVIVVNDFAYVQGGASRVAIDECCGLAARGVRVTFFAAVGPACLELMHPSINVVLLGQSQLSDVRDHAFTVFRSLWNFPAYQAMQALLSDLDPLSSVVHLHGYTKALTSSPVRAAVDRGFKVICTLHDFFLACPNGAFFNFADNNICPLTALSSACITTNCDKRRASHKAFRVVRSLIQKTAGRFPTDVKHYVALSTQSASLLSRYLPAGSRVTRCPNPISVVRRRPVDVASNRGTIAVGRLDIEKGIVTLIDAAKKIASSIRLVGDGPLRPYAEKYPGCKVTGWIDRESVMSEIENSRCLIFPSLWYETFGLVVEEAAARGVPSIVSDTSAAAERVVDGVTGWHFRAGDAVDLARCLGNLDDDDAVRRAGSAAFSRFWDAPSTPAKHTEDLLNIYSKMLGDGKPAREVTTSV